MYVNIAGHAFRLQQQEAVCAISIPVSDLLIEAAVSFL